ncbi:MAG TPA: hypothetical protein P5550_05790 [Bacteroidales bacterium]|nr:hypothetical protein [Bacteroidales bacterium]
MSTLSFLTMVLNTLTSLVAVGVFLRYKVFPARPCTGMQHLERFFIVVGTYYDLFVMVFFRLIPLFSPSQILNIYDISFPILCLLALQLRGSSRRSDYLILVGLGLSVAGMVFLPNTHISNLYWIGSISSILLTLFILVRYSRKAGLDFFQGMLISSNIALGATMSYLKNPISTWTLSLICWKSA